MYKMKNVHYIELIDRKRGFLMSKERERVREARILRAMSTSGCAVESLLYRGYGVLIAGGKA